MERWFRSGHAMDLGLAAMCLEALWLAGRGRLRGYLPVLIAGAALLCALRAALTGASWMVVGAFVSASLPAHVLDFWSRHRPIQTRLTQDPPKQRREREQWTGTTTRR